MSSWNHQAGPRAVWNLTRPSPYSQPAVIPLAEVRCEHAKWGSGMTALIQSKTEPPFRVGFALPTSPRAPSVVGPDKVPPGTATFSAQRFSAGN